MAPLAEQLLFLIHNQQRNLFSGFFSAAEMVAVKLPYLLRERKKQNHMTNWSDLSQQQKPSIQLNLPHRPGWPVSILNDLSTAAFTAPALPLPCHVSPCSQARLCHQAAWAGVLHAQRDTAMWSPIPTRSAHLCCNSATGQFLLPAFWVCLWDSSGSK